jgi:hypothetical protein
MHRYRLFVVVALVLLAGSLNAQELLITSESELDWQRGTLRVSMTATAGADTDIRPGFLHRAQQRIDAEFPNALFNALLSLRVNSVELVEDVVVAEPLVASRIAALSQKARPGLARPFPDLSGVTQDYQVPIFPDFVNIFVEHTIPFGMEEVISWVPTADFTGVVIYAADPLTLRGTDEKVYPAPALLPEIYDENLRPVLQQDMLNPDAVRQRGVVAYTSDPNEDAWRARIGGNPYRIMARQVYGVHPTDIVIGAEDADRLLSTRHNRELLQNGRILVILDDTRIHITE